LLLSRKRVCQAGNPVDQIIKIKRFEDMIAGTCGATAFQTNCFGAHRKDNNSERNGAP